MPDHSEEDQSEDRGITSGDDRVEPSLPAAPDAADRSTVDWTSTDARLDPNPSEIDAGQPSAFPADRGTRTPIIEGVAEGDSAASDSVVEAELDHESNPGPIELDSLEESQTPVSAGQLVTADGRAFVPAPTEPIRVQPLDRIRYLKSYYFIFDSQSWLLAVLAGFLCVFVSQAIPIVPYIVFGGYLLFVIESQLAAPETPYPDFQFEKFAEYLSKAVWSFLIGMGFMVIVGALYLTCYFGGLFGIIAAASNQDADTVGLTLSVGLPTLVLFWMGIIGGTIILSSAMMLRAGLAGSFVEAFRVRWLWDFFKRTWVEQILAAAFFTIAYNMLTILGLFAFCVGAFAGQGIAMMAHAQIVSQLYRLYLSRGGEPIPGHVFSGTVGRSEADEAGSESSLIE